MKTLASTGLLWLLMAFPVAANNLHTEFKSLEDGNNSVSVQSAEHKRFAFNTQNIRKYGDWQNGKLTTNLYKVMDSAPTNRRISPYQKLQLSEFSVVGMARSQIRNSFGVSIEPLVGSKDQKIEDIENFSVSQPGNCASSGVVWLQLAFVDDHVTSYRYCSFNLK